MKKGVKVGFGTAGLGVSVLVLIGAFFVGVGTSGPRYAPPPEDLAAKGRAADLASLEVERTLESPVGRVRWTLVSYDSSDGPCLEVVAEVIDGTDHGRLGGCGASEDPQLRWSIGGIDIGGQWYNVAYGQVALDASSVQVTLGNGSVQADSGVRANNGAWIIVLPADPMDSQNEFIRIEALTDSGAQLAAAEELPSLVAYRRAAAGHAASGEGGA